MLNHHLVLLYRNFIRSKGYFLINLIGLATGLACTLMIYLWVVDEVSKNKFHQKIDRLYQVMEHQQYADEIMTTTSTPGLLAETLKSEIPEIEHAATTTWVNAYTLSIEDHNVKAKGFHVGKDYFNIFSYSLLQGTTDQVLEDKYSMVISKALAIKLFGTEQDVVGKSVELQHEKTFKVTGVFDDITNASSYQFDFVLNFEEFKDENEWVLQWGNNGPSTFITLYPGSNAESVSEKIADFIKKREEDSHVTLFLAPFADRYLKGSYANGTQAGGRIEYVRLFSIIAVFILFIACINFMNLSTARASKKAKEVGIKKAIGAQRGSLIFQYLTESVLTSLLSMLVAIAVVWLLLPQFNLITDKQIVFTITPSLLIGMVLITVLTGLLAGSYPALFLSGFMPAKVLKGEVCGTWGELWARKGLVVFQFFLSVVLIVSVIVIYKQINYVQSKNLGYTKEQLIRFPIEGKVEKSLSTFLQEVNTMPGIVRASSMSHSFLGRNNNTSGLNWEGKNPEDLILFENVRVNHGALETMGIELAEGRFFSDAPADTTKIIFNEAAIRIMNLENPIGSVIRLWDEYDLEIIGVVKDFHFQSLHDVVNPMFIVYQPSNTWNIIVRLEAGKEKETLVSLTDYYAQFNPGFSLEYSFQDDDYSKLYASEQRVATLAGYFAGFAVLISCLGLFALAAFTAERRIKEIGIRKALGCSSLRIVVLLSADFTKMVLISIFFGLPVGYYFLSGWLERFAFHVELEISYFVWAGILALLITWITIASQAIKAARVNPVDCLKDE